MKYVLRKYQKQAIERLRSSYRNRNQRVVLVSPTGSGKTVIASDIVERATIKNGGRVLFIAHRKEIIDQTSTKLTEIGVPHGVMMGDDGRKDPSAPVQIASIQTLIRRELPPTDFIIVDECVTGDTEVITEFGPTKIKDIPLLNCRTILTEYNGSAVMKNITAWWKSGKKEVYKLKFSDGRKLTCTADHKIKTKRGWIKAANLKKTDKIMSCVAVDAKQNSIKINGEDNNTGYRDTTKNQLKEQHQSIGKLDFKDILEMHRNVPAVVENRYFRHMGEHYKALNSCVVRHQNTTNINLTTLIKNLVLMQLLHIKKLVLLLAHVLEIPAYYYRIQNQKITDLYQTMVLPNNNGLITKQNISKNSVLEPQKNQTQVGVKHILALFQDVFHVLQKSYHYCIKISQKLYSATLSINLAMLDSPGGSVMTVLTPWAKDVYNYQPMVFINHLLLQRENGFLNLDTAESKKTQEVKAITSILEQPQATKSSNLSHHMYQNVWNINYVDLLETEKVGEEPVYDITVKDTHSFFANGILAHNCHLSLAVSYQKVLAHYENTPILGLTATPWRTDGRGLGRIFEDMVMVSQVKELVRGGYLLAPEIYAPYRPDLSKIKIRAGDYVEADLSSTMDKNHLVGSIISHWGKYAHDMCTVVFACSRPHSQHIVNDFLKAGVAAAHLDYKTPRNERNQILELLASGKLKVVSNVGILTTGWDLPQLQCIIMARPTMSETLYLQMVGRVMRTTEGKNKAIMLDHAGCFFRHNSPIIDRDYSLDDRHIKRKGKKLGTNRIKTCPDCYRVCSSNATVCKTCGYEFKDRRILVEEPGHLYKIQQEFIPSCKKCGEQALRRARVGYISENAIEYRCAACKMPNILATNKARELTQTQRHAEFYKLRAYGLVKSYDKRWAHIRYQDLFGVTPEQDSF